MKIESNRGWVGDGRMPLAMTKVPAQTMDKGRKPIAMTPVQNSQNKPATPKTGEK
jgi:hypothetical protein